MGTGGTRPASAALELLDDATLPCGDLPSILPHCRFLAIDLGALRPAPSAHTVVLGAGPGDPTVSMLLIMMLSAVGPALDPAQHVLLLVDGAAQAAVARVDGTAAPLPNTSLRLLREVRRQDGLETDRVHAFPLLLTRASRAQGFLVRLRAPCRPWRSTCAWGCRSCTWRCRCRARRRGTPSCAPRK